MGDPVMGHRGAKREGAQRVTRWLRRGRGPERRNQVQLGSCPPGRGRGEEEEGLGWVAGLGKQERVAMAVRRGKLIQKTRVQE